MNMWHHRIVEARSYKELLDAAREYLASLTPHEWASIPRGCRPDRIKGIDDLEFWHRRLAEEYLEIAATSQATLAFCFWWCSLQRRNATTAIEVRKNETMPIGREPTATAAALPARSSSAASSFAGPAPWRTATARR